jgi:hypothetical protein
VALATPGIDYASSRRTKHPEKDLECFLSVSSEGGPRRWSFACWMKREPSEECVLA